MSYTEYIKTSSTTQEMYEWIKDIILDVNFYTIISDTGTDNSRIILFGIPGTSIRLQIGTAGASLIYINLVFDNGTITRIAIIYFNTWVKISIVKKNNLHLMSFTSPSSSTSSGGILSFFNEGIWRSIRGSDYFLGYSAFIPSAGNSTLSFDVKEHMLRSGLKTKNGKLLILPYYAFSADQLTIDETPVEGLYTFGNVDGLVPSKEGSAKVTIQGAEYVIVVSTNITYAFLIKMDE